MRRWMETRMGQLFDSLTTYAVALLALMLATVLAHASTAATLGGLVLLLLRLYVDGSKAWRAYKRNKLLASGVVTHDGHEDKHDD